MPFWPIQLIRRVVGAALVTVLITSCGDVHRVRVSPKEVQGVLTVSQVFRDKALRRRAVSQTMRFAGDVLTVERAAVLLAVAKNAETVNHVGKSGRGVWRRPSATVSAHSDAWWHGVAICEQGGRNDDFFGYFSYMDGSAGGGKSWEAQVAMGNRTIARYGDHAWAAACVAAGYRAAPGG